MRLFDSHVHMADGIFESDFDDMLLRMKRHHVEGAMVICDPGDLQPDHERAIGIVRSHPEFVLAAACHPQNALHFTDETERLVREIAALPFCTCIGETGLDDYDNRSTKEQQLLALNRQLDIACELDMPVQLHVRNAHGELLDILRKRKKDGHLPRGLVHCFTRNRDLAREYLRLGFYISISGTVTYRNANKLPEAVREIPVDRLLIETDAPWVTPEPYRGRRSEPAWISATFETVAALKNMDCEELSEILWNNAQTLLCGKRKG